MLDRLATAVAAGHLSDSSASLRDLLPLHDLRPVGAGEQRPPDLPPMSPQVGSQLIHAHPVNAGAVMGFVVVRARASPCCHTLVLVDQFVGVRDAIPSRTSSRTRRRSSMRLRAARRGRCPGAGASRAKARARALHDPRRRLGHLSGRPPDAGSEAAQRGSDAVDRVGCSECPLRPRAHGRALPNLALDPLREAMQARLAGHGGGSVGRPHLDRLSQSR